MKKTMMFLCLPVLIITNCSSPSGYELPLKFYDWWNTRSSGEIAKLQETDRLLQIFSVNGNSIDVLMKKYRITNSSESRYDMLHLLPGEYRIMAYGTESKPGEGIKQSLKGWWTLTFTAEAGKKYLLGYDVGNQISGDTMHDNYQVKVWIKESESKTIVSKTI